MSWNPALELSGIEGLGFGFQSKREVRRRAGQGSADEARLGDLRSFPTTSGQSGQLPGVAPQAGCQPCSRPPPPPPHTHTHHHHHHHPTTTTPPHTHTHTHPTSHPPTHPPTGPACKKSGTPCLASTHFGCSPPPPHPTPPPHPPTTPTPTPPTHRSTTFPCACRRCSAATSPCAATRPTSTRTRWVPAACAVLAVPRARPLGAPLLPPATSPPALVPPPPAMLLLSAVNACQPAPAALAFTPMLCSFAARRRVPASQRPRFRGAGRWLALPGALCHKNHQARLGVGTVAGTGVGLGWAGCCAAAGQLHA